MGLLCINYGNELLYVIQCSLDIHFIKRSNRANIRCLLSTYIYYPHKLSNIVDKYLIPRFISFLFSVLVYHETEGLLVMVNNSININQNYGLFLVILVKVNVSPVWKYNIHVHAFKSVKMQQTPFILWLIFRF